MRSTPAILIPGGYVEAASGLCGLELVVFHRPEGEDLPPNHYSLRAATLMLDLPHELAELLRGHITAAVREWQQQGRGGEQSAGAKQSAGAECLTVKGGHLGEPSA